jgi:sugar-specific transcriptional regulator TrmB
MKLDAEIVVLLLERGEQGATSVARELESKRPTVYLALERLVKLGFVLKHRGRGRTLFSALAAEELGQIIADNVRRESEDAARYAISLTEVLKHYPSRSSKSYGKFSIKTIESPQRIYQYLTEWLTEGEFVSIFNPQIAITTRTRPIVDKFLEHSNATKQRVRDILVSGPQAKWYQGKVDNPYHEIRLFPEGTTVKSDIMVSKGRVIFVDYARSAETAICIEHRGVSDSMQATFEAVWSSLA